jgi:hypothetical protein
LDIISYSRTPLNSVSRRDIVRVVARTRSGEGQEEGLERPGSHLAPGEGASSRGQLALE